MATAPKPGKARRDEEREQSRQLVYRMTVRGEELALRHADIGPADAALIRRETGMTLRTVLRTAMGDDGDLDVYAALWWLAKRKAGDDATYDVVVGKFPTYAELDQIRFLVDVEDGEGTTEDSDSPEA
jgi:hypothetical protein